MKAANDRGKASESRENTGDGANPPTTRLRLPLKTIQDVQRELARLYRSAKAGERDVAEASKLGNLLAILSRSIEGADLAARVEALEDERQNRRTRWVPPQA